MRKHVRVVALGTREAKRLMMRMNLLFRLYCMILCSGYDMIYTSLNHIQPLTSIPGITNPRQPRSDVKVTVNIRILEKNVNRVDIIGTLDMSEYRAHHIISGVYYDRVK